MNPRLPLVTSVLLSVGLLHCGSHSQGPPGTNPTTVTGSGTGSTPGAGGAPVIPGSGGSTPLPPGSGGGPSSGGSIRSSGGANGGASTRGPNTAPGFASLAPPMGAPLTPDGGTTLDPAAPAGWNWYPIDGAVCRDGSPTGFYVHWGKDDGLLLYLEGGGACSDDHFCAFNPNSVAQVLSGDGQTVGGSTLGAVAGRQQPGIYTANSTPSGVFDTANPDNPFKDWHQIYVPYCTGDVFFGTHTDATVANVPAGAAKPQQFVGYLDMQKFVGRIVPTFKDRVKRVILTGASAGGFGAALNFSMVQDAFGEVPVDVIIDSGPPFKDDYMPACMQKLWRELWGLDGAMPPDCKECKNADGGGLVNMADFLIKKHPNAKIALISSMEDEVIRLFYSMGLQNCANFATADPVAITLFQGDPNTYMAASVYTAGLDDLRAHYLGTNRFATYYMNPPPPANAYHQHIFRPRFYEAVSGGETIAQFVTDFLGGANEQVGP